MQFECTHDYLLWLLCVAIDMLEIMCLTTFVFTQCMDTLFADQSWNHSFFQKGLRMRLRFSRQVGAHAWPAENETKTGGCSCMA